MAATRNLIAQLWLVLLFFSSSALAAAEYTLKFATLAPPGSSWMNIMQEWGDQVKQQSKGRLVFKFYPGGVQGDEPDVLKKMRFNQLQGGAFTGYGIGHMYSPARVLELPFLFDSIEEVDYVRKDLMPGFKQGFRDNGYELLGWMEVGFVHMFSKKPIASMDEIRASRVWLWQGDAMGQAFFKASGISPVPLSIVDVYTSLSTGLIDTVYCTPLAAIALQWFTKTKYVSSISMTNAIGGLIVSRRFFDKLPDDLKTILQKTGHDAGEKLIATTREDNLKSATELKQRGLIFLDPGTGMDRASLIDIRDHAAAELIASDYIPSPVFERTRSLLQQYRLEHADDQAP